jgi:hypothetical protein
MTKIYDQHDAAFSRVSAYAVLHDGKPVAKVAFKFAASGLTTYAYVHWTGLQMTRGRAGGGGYDKCSAAVAAAVSRSTNPGEDVMPARDGEAWDTFRAALAKDDGAHWDNRLRSAGFDVFQVV